MGAGRGSHSTPRGGTCYGHGRPPSAASHAGTVPDHGWPVCWFMSLSCVALLVNLTRSGTWADALGHALEPVEHERLAGAGHQREHGFTWDAAATTVGRLFAGLL